MNKPPAFQFYADDFIGGTVAMTHEERGLYILLLCLQWTQGAITKDDAARLGSTVVEPSLNRVLTKFQDTGNGLLQNRRLESEREKQIAFRERQINAGLASAKARFNRGSTVVQPEGQPKLNSPSPSPSPNKHDIERGFAERPGLEEVKTYAAQIGLGPWKAEDWFHEMEGCGWLDFNHRPVAKWKPLLLRVKTKWEADGRPTAPPSAKVSPASNGAQRGPSPFGPPLAEVKEYAREKDDGTGRAVANALHWWGFWEKRNWKKKDGRSVDWKVELSAHLANSVGKL